MPDRKTVEGPEPATITTLFAAPSEYVAAWDTLLPHAVTEVLIFDRDLREGGWSSLNRSNLLRDFMFRSRLSKLQIVLHDTTYVEGHLPRLLMLLREFSHKIQILRTIGDGRNAWDAFAIVDGRHVLHRFHQNVMKGELALFAPVKAREVKERYDELLMFTESGVNATQLGL
jgi:hypothetical protein